MGTLFLKFYNGSFGSYLASRRGAQGPRRLVFLDASRWGRLVLVDTPVTENVIETLKQMPHLTVVQLDNTGVPTAKQLELVRFLSPRARARTQRQVEAAQQR